MRNTLAKALVLFGVLNALVPAALIWINALGSLREEWFGVGALHILIAAGSFLLGAIVEMDSK